MASGAVVPWALRSAGLTSEAAPAIEAALADAGVPAGSPGVTWGLEVHHDDPGRVDLAVGRPARPGRRLVLGDVRITTGDFDVREYDIDHTALTATWELAGIFHGVQAAQLPPVLTGLGTPVLAAHLKGRGGQVRLLLPVPTTDALLALCAMLAAAGFAEESLVTLRGLAPLITDAGVLRLGVEYLPDVGRLGSRLGAEVLLNPAVFDVAPVLSALGVPTAVVARLQATAGAVPVARERPRGIPWLPKLQFAPMVDAVGFTHFSVAWAPGVPLRVKSYLMVTSLMAGSDPRDTVLGPRVWRAGTPWPARLAWAQHQLPLAAQYPPAVGSSPDAVPATAMDDAWTQWQRALGAQPAEGDSSQPRRETTDGPNPGAGPLLQRLRGVGMTTAQARVALSDASPVAEPPPDWLPWFTEFYDACVLDGASAASSDDAAALAWLAAREADLPDAAGDTPFAVLWWPAVVTATERLMGQTGSAGAEDAAEVALSAISGVQLALLSRLSMVSAPTLLRAMSDELTYGQRLLRKVMGSQPEPPRSAFARFCAGLASGGLAAVLLEHPVLPSLIGTVVRQWHEATLEMLNRVQRHRGDLAEHFGIDAAADLTAVVMSAGDHHNDGRSVTVLQFGHQRVVYKPRDVQLEHLWADVLATVGDQGAPLRAARAIAAHDAAPYGFTEFIHHQPAVDAQERHAFYRNAGRTLAMLYALSATDCHHENLIAHGDQLVLIDAEALFETRNTRMHALEPSESRSLGTVMDVGLLPVWMWLEGEQQAIDISALGASPESMRGRASRAWQAVNTDAMHRGPIEVIPEPPTSLPTAGGAVLDLTEYADDVVAGFEQEYRAIVVARERLGARLRSGAGLHRRLIQRATYIYAALLHQSVEPDALRGRNARAMVLERLARAYLGGPPQVWALMAAEQEALARLDVPMFETDLRGTGTKWLHGELPDWPGEDALAGVLARLAGLNEDDLRWQSTLIRSAIAARRFTPDRGARRDGERPLTGAADRTRVARRVSAAVTGDALRSEGAATWMTLALLNDGEHVNVQRIGTGLYDGVLGVAAYLYDGDNEDLAAQALAPLFEELESADAARVSRQMLAAGVGWSGAGGYLRALRWLEHRHHLDPPRADSTVTAVLESLNPAMLAHDTWLDVMNGSAGLIGPLAIEATGASAGRRGTIEALVAAAAEHLLEVQRDDGGWMTLPGRAALTGYAHGASGIALALVSAHLALGEQRYLDAAVRGLAYETSTFNATVGNWPDFRETARSGFMLGWCAGAPGIALTRARLLHLLPGHPAADQWQRELEAAVRTTAGVGLLERDHLCCGNLGRVAILEALGFEYGRDDWLAAADRLRGQVLARCGAGLPRPFLDVPGTGDDSALTRGDLLSVPGLMTGLAGQGWVLNASEPADTHRWVSALLV